MAKLMLWHGSGPGKAVLVCGAEEWGLCWIPTGTAKDAECEVFPKVSINMRHVWLG